MFWRLQGAISRDDDGSATASMSGRLRVRSCLVLSHNASGKILKRELRTPSWEGHERQVNENHVFAQEWHPQRNRFAENGINSSNGAYQR